MTVQDCVYLGIPPGMQIHLSMNNVCNTFTELCPLCIDSLAYVPLSSMAAHRIEILNCSEVNASHSVESAWPRYAQSRLLTSIFNVSVFKARDLGMAALWVVLRQRKEQRQKKDHIKHFCQMDA